MVRQADIIAYARTQSEFTCREMLCDFKKSNLVYSKATITSCLQLLTEKGVLRKVRRGVYAVADARQQCFVPYYDERMQDLELMIRERFRFIRFCVWNSFDINRFSHYVVNMDVIYVDVERVAMDAVFTFLLNANLDRQVYLKPSEDDYLYYIYGKPTIVVRSLVSESPLVIYAGVSDRITIEKLLVDIAVDKDFAFLHDYESSRFYRNAIDSYCFNETKLLRYANRRSCKDKIKNILDIAKQNEFID